MVQQMTQDEETVLETIKYLEEKGNLAYSEDIKSNCILTEKEVYTALSSLRAKTVISIGPRGWSSND